jgi:hypothetical protein
MAHEQLIGWQPDPFAIHEFRYFSRDGKPTLLVSDEGVRSHDPPPNGPVKNGSGAVPMGSDPPVAFAGAQGVRAGEEAGAPYVDMPSQPVPSGPHSSMPLTVTFKVAYGIVGAIVLASVVALLVTHIGGPGKKPPSHSGTSATTTTASIPTSSTVVSDPPVQAPSATDAAAALVSDWASGNRTAALSVATASAVNTLFAARYTSGLAISRGCSSAFPPIVCTYGPPGGADPTDPIYEIDATQTTKGWFVSSVRIEN